MSPARRALLSICALALGLGPRASAHANAKLMVMNADGAGEGFNDTTPAAPIGGNTGKTLGEQRMIAVQHAADLWGEVLDSAVPIVISATFDELGCSGTAAILAQAQTAGVHSGVTGDGADPNLLYPRALAERLAGMDLAPGEPDIQAFFNTSIDDSSCGAGGWYYGLDANSGGTSDLVNTALHEFGHGLGVTVLVDLDTGQPLGGIPSAYSTHIFDSKIGKHWDAMSDSERMASITNVRSVAWDGAETTAAAHGFLAAGTPSLRTTPAVAGLSEFVSDASFGIIPRTTPATGTLAVGNPVDGCTAMNDVAGKIILLSPVCLPSSIAVLLQQGGALGALMALPSDRDSPPVPIEEPDPMTVRIPVLSVSPADMQLLTNAVGQGSVSAELSADSAILLGADAQGRVLLNVTNPVSSSSISHWDVLARPNLLMEPIATPGEPSDVDLTAPMLHDLGWAPFCGNDRIDADETCDDGADNSDTAADACRTSCQVASCGDGVKDTGEKCDKGTLNSDQTADACRSDCTPARCGDGVVDKGEGCDDGDKNSDVKSSACRSDCTPARCGDGVADQGEACDDGDKNSDSAPNACRKNCTSPSCGDGLADQGEACDDGDKNSDSAPNACRKDCTSPSCGDGVIDQGEACDDGDENSNEAPDACRKNCTSPSCGDGVVDKGEACDDGGGRCTECSASAHTHADAGEPGDAGDAGEASDAGRDVQKHAMNKGCSCDLVGARPNTLHAQFASALVLGLLALRLRRRRCATWPSRALRRELRSSARVR